MAYHKLFKRTSRKLFNTPWEFQQGTEVKTFKACYKKMKVLCDRIVQTSVNQGKKNYAQFEIRKYDKDAWGEEVVFKTKTYNVNLEEIKK